MTVRFYSSVAAETALVGTVSGVATTVQLASVVGLPPLTPYTLALDYESSTEELVEVTAAAGTTLTVTRAVDGTSGASHTAGARVRHTSSARDFADSRTHENSSSSVHGLSPTDGDVVGEDATQTLTNKTLTLATGTLQNIDILNTANWVTSISGDAAFPIAPLLTLKPTSVATETATILNDGALIVRNKNLAADSAGSTYRLRATKNNGTTDIFYVTGGGTVFTKLNTGNIGFTVVPPTDGSATRMFRSTDPTGATDRVAIFNDGHVDINASDPTFSILNVTSAPAQAASMTRWIDSSANTLASVTASGLVDAGRGARVNAGVLGVTTLRLVATAGQTADLTRWTNVGEGITLANVDILGRADFAALDVATGVATAATGWSISAQKGVRKAGIITVAISAERTGANITADAAGNITDTLMFTIASDWRPNAAFSGSDIMSSTVGDGFGDGAARLTPTTGQVEIASWSNTGAVTTGRIYRFTMTYVA